MSKHVKIVRTGEFVIEPKDSTANLSVTAEIDGKPVELFIREGWNNPQISRWHFLTDNGFGKDQNDFSVFDLFDIKVSADDILAEATALFKAEKEKEQAENAKKATKAREEYYDHNIFLTILKPNLERRGHKVDVLTTRQEYAENRKDLYMKVDDIAFLDYDYHGWFRARSKGDGELQVEKISRSNKQERLVEAVEYVINTVNSQKKKDKEEEQKRADDLKALEAVLGEEVIEKSEAHSRQSYDRKNRYIYWNSYYMVRKSEENNPKAVKFIPLRKYEDGKDILVSFRVTNLPALELKVGGDGSKLTALLDLLSEKE